MCKALNNGKVGSSQYSFSVLFYDRHGKADKVKHFTAREGEFLVIHTDWHDPSISYATASDYKKLGDLMPPSDRLEEQYQKGRDSMRELMIPKNYPERDEEPKMPRDGYLQGIIELTTEELLRLHLLDYKSNGDMRHYFERMRDLSRKAIDLLDVMRIRERAESRAQAMVEKGFRCLADCKHLPDMGSDNIEELPETCQMCRRCELLSDKYDNGKEQV